MKKLFNEKKGIQKPVKTEIEKLEDLSKEELLEFIKYYDGYVIESCDDGNIPVCVEEFFYNDYPVIKHINDNVGGKLYE